MEFPHNALERMRKQVQKEEAEVNRHAHKILSEIRNNNFNLAAEYMVCCLNSLKEGHHYFTIVWTLLQWLYFHGKASQFKSLVDLIKANTILTSSSNKQEQKSEPFGSKETIQQIHAVLQGKKKTSPQGQKPGQQKLPSPSELNELKHFLIEKVVGRQKYPCKITDLKTLDSHGGLLKVLLTFGNTLDVIYLSEYLKSSCLFTMCPDFKNKRCHQCMRPIFNSQKALFCSNIFQGLSSSRQACLKFTCKDCLGDQWVLNKGSLLFKCPCCRAQCSPKSLCDVNSLVKRKPQEFINKEIFWYQWRGKREHVRAIVIAFDKIKKQHKLVLCENKANHKVPLERESFFLVDDIPTTSPFADLIRKKNEINFKKLMQQHLEQRILSFGWELADEGNLAKIKQRKGSPKLQSQHLSEQSSTQSFQDVKLLSQPIVQGSIGRIEEDDLSKLRKYFSESSAKTLDKKEEQKVSPSIKISTRKQLGVLLKNKKDITQLHVDEELYQQQKSQYYKSINPFAQKDNKKSLSWSTKQTSEKSPPFLSSNCTHKVQSIKDDALISMQKIAKEFPENLIGAHIFVYWELDHVWYRGKITKYLQGSRRFKVLYDDEREERLDLTVQKFQIEETEKEDSLIQIPLAKSPPKQDASVEPDLVERIVRRDIKGNKILGKRSSRQPPAIATTFKRMKSDAQTYQTNRKNTLSTGPQDRTTKQKEKELRKELACMQETTIDDVKFYHLDFNDSGHHSDFKGTQQGLLLNKQQDQLKQKPAMTSQEQPLLPRMEHSQEREREQNKQPASSGSFVHNYLIGTRSYENRQNDETGGERGLQGNQDPEHNQVMINLLTNAKDLIKSSVKKDLASIEIDQSKIGNSFPQFEFKAYIDDCLKKFYSIYETQGYKKCQCSSCLVLVAPPVIKNSRSFEEYEKLHLKYLKLNYKYDKKEPTSEQQVEVEKVNNVRLAFF